MALDTIQQLKNLLGKSKNALLILPQEPDSDALVSSWAFYFFLKKINIDPTIAFSGKKENELLSFLPQPEKIIDNVTGAKDFILSFNTKYNKVVDFKTEKKENEFLIYLTPEKGSFDPRDFSFMPAKFKFDLVFVIGSPDKESTGKIYEESPDIFYEVPVINIDNHSNNENFGQINFTDITASSVSEIIFEILNNIENNFIEEDIATCLLSGIISATDSFQKKNTTPKALRIAAELMNKGADQQKIVRFLYKTHPFSTLKLWGKIMSKLKWDEETRLAWATVSIDDFVQSRSNPKDLLPILEKIKENYSSGKFFLVLYNESLGTVSGIMKTPSPEEAEKIAHLFEGKTKKDFVFLNFSKSIEEVERVILEKLK